MKPHPFRVAGHLVALLGIVAWLCAVGCQTSYDSLSPFPCAEDGTCPGGLACVPGAGCVTARLDGPCDATTNCGAAAPGAACVKGVCATPCGNDGGEACEKGRICAAESEGGGCLPDCTESQECPPGLTCRLIFDGARRACAGPGASFPSCKSVDLSETVCALCGPGDYTTSCGSGFCALDAVCRDNKTCSCSPGFTSAGCPSTSFGSEYCAPAESKAASATCNDVLRRSSGTCVCSDGRRLPFDCDTQISCETRCATCDVLAQDCQSPVDTKCTIKESAPNAYVPACVAPGTVGLKRPCTRAAFGDDDCDGGLFCSRFGTPDGGTVCRAFCAADADCPSGYACARNVGYTIERGVCIPTCTLFGGTCAGGSCRPAMDANGSTFIGLCSATGTGKAGAACAADSECAANTTCSGGRCTAICDAQHACPSNCTCSRYRGLPTAGGVCDCGPNQPAPAHCGSASECSATGEVCCAQARISNCRYDLGAGACQPPSRCVSTFTSAGCVGAGNVRICEARKDCTEPGYSRCCRVGDGLYSICVPPSSASAANCL